MIDRKVVAGDWLARQFFSPEELQMSPEEYAARHAHLWGCFSLHEYDYDDVALGVWVRRLGEILQSPTDLEQCRLDYLTPMERVDILQQEAEDF